MKKCEHCGAPIRWYDRACPQCGTTLTSEIPEEPIAFSLGLPAKKEMTRSQELPKNLEIAQESLPEKKKEIEPAPPIKDAAPSGKKTPSKRRTGRERFAADWRKFQETRYSCAGFSRAKTFRYAIWIVFELVVCPPCAILGAYFYWRAISYALRVDYSNAARCGDRARTTLTIGLGILMTALCLFVFYVGATNPSPPKNDVPDSEMLEYT